MPEGDALRYDDVVGTLERVVARCAATGDRAGYFASMYLAVTNTVRQRSMDGRFEDATRMERFVCRFAARYLDAEQAWRDGGPCTESWRLAFRAAGRWRPIALQHVLLGINAHINLDLGIVAADIGGSALETVRADFDAVNDVLGDLVDNCQGALGSVSPWLDLADRIGGDGDETLIRFSLVRARRHAWYVAHRVASLPAEQRASAIAAVDAATVRIGRAVEHPGVLASALLLVVRVRERAAPGDVMAVLAAVRPESGAPG